MVEIYTETRYNNQGSSKTEPYAGIAQSVEHFTRNEGVVSSSLISGFVEKAQSITEDCAFWRSYAYSVPFYSSLRTCTVS